MAYGRKMTFVVDAPLNSNKQTNKGNMAYEGARARSARAGAIGLI